MINMLSVGAPQQVMLEVKVAEVSKTLVDQLGASIGGQRTNGSWTYSILTNLLVGVLTPGRREQSRDQQLPADRCPEARRPGQGSGRAEHHGHQRPGSQFPGRRQNLHPGQRQQQQWRQSGNPARGKEFGIAVRFTPTVLEGGRINLRVAPEVSDLNREGVGISMHAASTAPRSCPPSPRGAPPPPSSCTTARASPSAG
ncbi:hypothetical protein LP420_31070 [Massilia sp. B-10]|nr:hypothetical protein LP420_31070 [Massilia sp. B-10]